MIHENGAYLQIWGSQDGEYVDVGLLGRIAAWQIGNTYKSTRRYRTEYQHRQPKNTQCTA
jgi:hypothetical protein